MTLEQYLTREKLSQAAFAARIGLSKATVSQILSGAVRAGVETALKIVDGSDGEIDAETLPLVPRAAETLRKFGVIAPASAAQ